ncbi:dihydrofolate reductase [Mesomycoplasma neurolyticum]|uniref:dihydrofolate reductase n=1 Tax=Mesomycoplasma neurolyticum TaxID=2120 RepID=A0A449A6C8_9BACT|nr:dihydrofolate reductase [Mesomycoplasma neurolyticum]VEU59840.1 Dihydrofolate reductase [Mesomycoplasma neurolyticum]
MIIAIWAMTKDGLIGKDNQMPWYIKEEFQHFRNTTLNKTLLMGKNTFFSLPKILDNRKMFVLSHEKDFKIDHPDVEVVYDYKELIKKYKNNPNEDLYITGGLYVYQQLIPLCDKLIVSIVEGNYEGNKYLKVDFSNFYQHKDPVKYQKFTVFYYKKK